VPAITDCKRDRHKTYDYILEIDRREGEADLSFECRENGNGIVLQKLRTVSAGKGGSHIKL
jgi:hypothetical protein